VNFYEYQNEVWMLPVAYNDTPLVESARILASRHFEQFVQTVGEALAGLFYRNGRHAGNDTARPAVCHSNRCGIGR
jgi:hypothetical protein